LKERSRETHRLAVELLAHRKARDTLLARAGTL
jgi:hypothetical protein